jgi:predicted acylesterase/phospholipase RssA
MEGKLIENRLQEVKPDLYIAPKLKNIEIMDFHLVGKILEDVRDDALQFKDHLWGFLTKDAPLEQTPE